MSSPVPASPYPGVCNEHRHSAQDGGCAEEFRTPAAPPLVAESPLSTDDLDTRPGGGSRTSRVGGVGTAAGGPSGLVSEGRMDTDPDGVGWSLRDDDCPLEGALA